MSLVFRRILAPTDFSDTAATSLYYAKELARQFDAELDIVHVDEDPMLLVGWPAVAVGEAPNLREAMAATRERLQNLLTPEDRVGLKLQVHVVPGHPGLAIPRYAVEGEFELIVMGTHGRGPLTHVLMGSVAEKVVRSAPCPVLTIRHPIARKIAAQRLQEALPTVDLP